MPLLPRLALLLALLLTPFPAAAQGLTPSTSAPAEEAAAPDTAEAARMLAETLQDPDALAALIAQLQAAAGAAEEAPATFDETLTRALADRTLGVAETISSGLLDVADTLGDWEGLAADAAAIDWRRIADDAIAVGLVMAVTVGLFWTLRTVTRPWRSRAAARQGPRSIAGRIAGLLIVSLCDTALILVAWGAGYALAIRVGDGGGMDLRQSLFLNAFLIVSLGRLALRLLLSPRRPSLRLTPLGDGAAQDLYRHAGRILAVVGYGVLLAVPIARGAFGTAAADRTSFAIAALAAVMAVRLILRNRQRVRAAIASRAALRASPDGVVKGALSVLAQIWHILAIAYVFGLFIVWTARPADSLGFMVTATLQSAAAIGVGSIAMVAIGRRIARGVRLSRRMGERLPMLEPRLNALVPNALSALRLLLFVVVLAVLLDIWGLFALGDWLAGETGRGVVQAVLSAGLILVVCGAIWIGVSSWIEYKITPRDGRLVRAREQTLLTLLRNAFTVVMVVMAGMLTLSAIGINIAPLLAGAGVIGLAIGFGAQKLVQDIITGVFIQLENAMNTGDVVTAGPVTGSVEKLTIRSVGLRDLSGTFHLVPFSSVDTVANFTKDYAWHVAEVGIGYDADIAQAKAVMKAAFDELKTTSHGASIIADFDEQGVIALAESAVTLRGRIRTVAGAQWGVGRAYTEILKRRMDEAGIELPFRNVTLHMGSGATPGEDARGPRLLRPEHAAEPTGRKQPIASSR